MMNVNDQHRSCHPERSEGSRWRANQILRCAQDDNTRFQSRKLIIAHLLHLQSVSEEHKMEITEKANRQTGIIALICIATITLLSLAALLARILSIRSKLRHASKPGRAASARVSPTDNPLTTFTRSGGPGDPINIQFVGTDGQIGAAFAAAGWYRADEIDFVTSARISIDSILGRKYTTAPVSNLFLYGRKEDMAFERPGNNARQRDHIRIWKTSQNASDGRPIWIGSTTKDTKVELAKTNHLPTHCISPDVDAERALTISELAQTGFVVQDTTRPGFGRQTHGFNGEGDPYVTDGQVTVLTIANVTIPPVATQVRSPLLARLTRRLASNQRHRLPQEGRERAAREQEQQTDNISSLVQN